MTDRFDGVVTITYVLLKTGCGTSCCDNTGCDGIFCRVDPDTGRIVSPGMGDDLRVHSVHPDSGLPLEGFTVPYFAQALALALRAAEIVPQVGHTGLGYRHHAHRPGIGGGESFAGRDVSIFCPYAGKNGAVAAIQDAAQALGNSTAF